MRIDIEGMTLEDVARRWPRLLRAMRWAGPLTVGEARCAVHCYTGQAQVDSDRGPLASLEPIRAGISRRHAARRAWHVANRVRVIEAGLEAFWGKLAEVYPHLREGRLNEQLAMDLLDVAGSAIDDCLMGADCAPKAD